MVLTIGHIGFFAVVAITTLYVFLRVIAGKGLPDSEAGILIMMSPIGGFLLGCIVGHALATFGVFIGAVLCSLFVLFFAVQYCRLQWQEKRKITLP